MSVRKLLRGDLLGFLEALQFEFSGALLGVIIAGILTNSATGAAAIVCAVVGFLAVAAAEKYGLLPVQQS